MPTETLIKLSVIPRFNLSSRGIELLEIHTSGHAYESQLKRLANALKPQFIIPIHTFYPEKYVEMFNNVIELKDGAEIDLEIDTKK